LLRWNIDESNRLQESDQPVVDGVLFASWHPQGEGLLVLNRDGKWNLISESGESEPLATSNWTSRASGSGLALDLAEVLWLQEPWLPETTNRWHVAILSHEPKGSRIDFISLDPSSNENFSPILSTSKITSFTTSPNENLLAIGDENGTLGVWFAAPSLDRGARELFTLPGHRGASIGQVSFSDDGNAILSSDINRKSIVWKSVK
jgi:WD40 repeat protein